MSTPMTTFKSIQYLTICSEEKEVNDMYAALDRGSELKCEKIYVTRSILETSYRAIYYWISDRYDKTKQIRREAAYRAYSEELKVLEAINSREKFIQRRIDDLEFELHLLDNNVKEIEINRETLYELLGHCEQVIAKPELANTFFPLYPYTFDESDLELKIIELPEPELSPEIINFYVRMCNEIRDTLRIALRDPFLRQASIYCSFEW